MIISNYELTEKIAEAPQAANLKLAAMLELGLELTAHRDPDRLLDIFCRAAIDVIGARYGALAILHDDGQSFAHFKCHAESKENLEDKMMPPSPRAGVLSSLLDEPRARRLRNPGGNPESLGLSHSHPPIHNFLGVPIASSQQLYGWFYLVDKLNDDDFSESDEQLTATLAAQLAVVYEAVQLYNDVQRHAARLELEVDRRKKAEERFHSAIQAAPNGMLMIDGEGKIVLLNSKIVELFGYETGELIGQPIEILIPERLRDKHVEHRAAFMLNPQPRSIGARRDLHGRRKDGSEFPVEIGLSPLATNEGPMVISSIIDITERKEADQTLRQSEERFREMAENINEIFFSISADGSALHYVSPAYEHIFGRKKENLYENPRDWLDAVHQDDRPRMEMAFESHLESLDDEYRIIRPDGQLRWIHVRSFPVRDGAGKLVRSVGIAADITERKRAEEALKSRHRELQTLQEVSQAVLATPDIQTTMEIILDKAISIGPFDLGIVRLFDPSTASLKPMTWRGYWDPANVQRHHHRTRDAMTGTMTARVMGFQEPRIEEDVPHSEGLRTWKREGVQSAIVIPVRTIKGVLGIFQLGNRTPHKFSPDEVRLLVVIGDQLGTAIQKSRANEETQRNLERIRALHEIDLAITSIPDLYARLHILLEKIELFVPITAVSTVRLLNSETGELEPLACRGMNEQDWGSHEPKAVASWAKRVAVTKAAVAVLDIPTLGSTSSDIYRRLGLSSYVGVPLITEGRVLGVLGLYTKQKHEFTAEEIEFLETLANQAAIAIDNAQLYEHTKKQHLALIEQERIQRILKELSQDITKMDVDALLEKLTSTIREVFKVDVSDVRFLTGGKWANIIVANEKLVQRLPDGGQFRQGATDWVLKNRKSIAIHDYLERKEFTPGRVAKMFGVRGFLAAPLMSKDNEVMGVIRALTKEPRTFTAREIDLIEQLASGAAIAVENARLYADLEKSNKAKSEFLSVMSHELRTPLNIIMGYAGLIKDDMVDDADQDHLKAVVTIETQANELLTMFTSIMQATQIESGATPVHKHEVDVCQLMQQLRALYDAPLDKNLALVWKYPQSLATLATDDALLTQILQKLIDNAIKFTKRGTVTVSARVDENFEFQVSDTGIGILEESLPVIFDTFKQVDGSSTREFGGAGLGLYIAKKFTELLGGSIEAESTVGQGSTFTIKIPCEQQTDSQAQRLGDVGLQL